MSGLEIGTLVVTVLVAFAWYLTYTAARLHRLHTRVEGTYAGLDAQLVRRAEAVLEVANSGLVDPAAALILAGAAGESLEGADLPQTEREAVESDVTRVLRLMLTSDDGEASTATDGARGPAGAREPGAPRGGSIRAMTDEAVVEDAVAGGVLDRLDSAAQRVTMARRFHNDAVTDVLRLRRNPLVRLFHLAGHTDLPRTVEFDDDHRAHGS